MNTPNKNHRNASDAPDARRRSFLKKAGTIVVAAPVMESLSREGLLVRSAHAQSAVTIEAVFGGDIGEPF